MKSDEALSAEQSLEAKFSDMGLDQVRGHSFPEMEAAPDGTPAEQEEVVSDRPRDEQGRFASTADEPVAETEEVIPSAEDPTGTGQDPAVAAYLAKYGGDIDKALAGAVHSQRKLGEQSNEVGDLRRMVDELAQIKESIQDQRQPQQQQQYLDQGTVDWFDQQVESNPQGAIEWARQQGNDLLVRRALDTWKDVDPYSAAVYTNDLKNLEFYSQMEQTVAKAQQLPLDASINVALTNVRSRHPEFSNYDDAIASAMEKYPSAAEAVQSSVNSGDRARLESAIETLYALAQRDTLADLALRGPTPETTTSTADVVAPTVSEPHEAAPEKSNVDQFREAFQQEMDQRRRGVFVAE